MALIHWWPLNGDLKDQGLNPVDLVNGGTTLNSNGKIGSCYSFDGSDDYLSITSSDLYTTFKGGSQPFSICLWFYNEDGGGRSIIFGDYSLSGAQNFNIEKTTSEYLRFYWNSDIVNPVPNTTLTVNTWIHISVVYNGANIKFYLNGNLIYTKTVTLVEKAKTSGAHYFGRDGRTGTTAFKGRMNDLRIYDHALTIKEIKDISRGLVAHYTFEDEDIETTVNLDPWKNAMATHTLPNLSNSGNMAYTFGNYFGYDCFKCVFTQYTTTSWNGTYCSCNPKLYGAVDGDTVIRSYWVLVPDNNMTKTGSFPVSIEGTADNKQTSGYDFNKRGTWQRVWGKCKLNSSGSPNMLFYFMSASANTVVPNFEFYIRDFQLQVSDHLTPYTPGTSNKKLFDGSGYRRDLDINGTPIFNSSSNNIKIGNGNAYLPSSGIYFQNISGKVINSSSKAFTVNCWIKSTSNSTTQCLFSHRTGTGTGPAIFIINGNSIRFDTVNTGCSCSYPTDLNWHMVTCTFDSTNRKIYIDGILKTTVATTDIGGVSNRFCFRRIFSR